MRQEWSVMWAQKPTFIPTHWLELLWIQRTGFFIKNQLIKLWRGKVSPSHKYSTHNQLLFHVLQLFIVATTHPMDINAVIGFLPDACQHTKIHWAHCCYSKLNLENSSFKWPRIHSMTMPENWSNASKNWFLGKTKHLLQVMKFLF